MILCYSCNQYKPGDVAPFAICDECRAGAEARPVKEQKSFIDMEKPKRTEYVVIVREIEARDNEYGPCQVMVGQGICGLNAGWTCKVCGQYTCDLHEDKDQSFRGNAICESCGKLSKAEQEAVVEFREKLNQG
jgi:hypothetical protein